MRLATERMYDLAFQFKEGKLWKLLYDNELFAVQLSDGEIGYCSVMGMLGEHLALGLYVGDEGYLNLRALCERDFASLDEIEKVKMITSQNCLQCSFENRDSLSPEELDEARAYARAHGRSFRGKCAFPQFTKYRPGRYPWHYDSERDERRICEALSAAIELRMLLMQHNKEELGLCPMDEGPAEIPLLRFEDGAWKLERTPLPEVEISLPEPVFVNEVLAMRIRRKKRHGSWQCATLRVPEPVQNEVGSDEVPFYPLVLVCLDEETGLLLEPVMTDGEDPAEIMNGFAKLIAEAEAAPQTIRCADDLCFALLKDLCAKTGIQIERADGLDEVREAMEDLLDTYCADDMTDDKTEELFEMLEQMSDDDLQELPRKLRDMLVHLTNTGNLPGALGARVRRLFH